MRRIFYTIALSLIAVCNTASADILDLTVDNNGTVALGGTMLLISGAITCDVPAGSLYGYTNLNANTIQISVGGKVVSQASSYIGSAQCAGAGNPIPFTLQMNTYNGSPFKPGQATVTAMAHQFVCDSNYYCTSFTKSVSEKVRLNP